MKTLKIETYAVVGNDKCNNFICERGLTLHQAKLYATKKEDKYFHKPRIYKDEDVIKQGKISIIKTNYKCCWMWDGLDKKWKKYEK